MALFANSLYSYALIFLLLGVGLDGFSNSSMNLVIEIAPEEKRPIYTALQTNLVSFGLFFPLLGGILLKLFQSYNLIYLLSILLLTLGLWISLKLEKRVKENYFFNDRIQSTIPSISLSLIFLKGGIGRTFPCHFPLLPSLILLISVALSACV